MMNESGDTAIDLSGSPHEEDKMEFGGFASNDATAPALELEGTIGSKERQGTGDDHDDDGSGSEDEIELLSASKVSKSAAIWKFEYWQGFFDVDTNDVSIVSTCFPRACLFVWVSDCMCVCLCVISM